MPLDNHRLCEAKGVAYAESVFDFSRPAIGHIFLYLFLEGIVFLLLAMLIEVSAANVH